MTLNNNELRDLGAIVRACRAGASDAVLHHYQPPLNVPPRLYGADREAQRVEVFALPRPGDPLP